MARPPTVLTIDVFDATGAFGLQADLKTLSSLGTHGMAVVTAISVGHALEPLAPGLITRQIDDVFARTAVDVVKTGVLGGVEGLEAVTSALRRQDVTRLVVDPVLPDPSAASNGGKSLLEAMRTWLVPLAYVITPNLPEAAALAGRAIDSWADARLAAEAIVGLGAANVVIKGGRRQGDIITDLLLSGGDFREYSTARIEAQDISGAGSAFAAAMAATLAKGETVQHSVAAAKAYVTKALQSAYELREDNRSLHYFYRYWQPRGA